jgi:excisionase family DNA binding protein
MGEGRLVLSVREAARVSGYPRDGLYEAIHDGRIRVIRRGRRIIVPTAELERFVELEASKSEGPGSSRPGLATPERTAADADYLDSATRVS